MSSKSSSCTFSGRQASRDADCTQVLGAIQMNSIPNAHSVIRHPHLGAPKQRAEPPQICQRFKMLRCKCSLRIYISWMALSYQPDFFGLFDLLTVVEGKLWQKDFYVFDALTALCRKQQAMTMHGG